MHNSTAFQASRLYKLLSNYVFPSWAVLIAGVAYVCLGHLLVRLNECHLPMEKDAISYYHSSSRVVIEQVFSIFISRWGISWSPLRLKVENASLVIPVAANMPNYIMDSEAESEHTIIPCHPRKSVGGYPVVCLQGR